MNLINNVIAETAFSHNGSIKVLKQLVYKISKTNIKKIKFQIFYPDEGTFRGDDEFYLFHKLALSKKEWKLVVNFAKSKSLEVYADIFGLKSFKLASSLGIDGFKIHNENSTDFDFVKIVLNSKKKTFVSLSGLTYIEKKIFLILLRNMIILSLFWGFKTFQRN